MPLNDQELCACGKPLHYTDPQKRRTVDEMIARLGPDVKVTVSGRGSWFIPRHFIALHGLIAEELPELAAKYKFKEVGK